MNQNFSDAQEERQMTSSPCSSSCSCIIDLSTPESLERDFNNWLHGINGVCDIYCQDRNNVTDTEGSPASTTASETSISKEDGRKKRKGTNLYGRPYCPGRPLSMEDRSKIIENHMSGMKVNAISKLLCISHGCVSKIISRYRTTGILSPASSPEQRRTRRRKNQVQAQSSLEMQCSPPAIIPKCESFDCPTMDMVMDTSSPIGAGQPQPMCSDTPMHDGNYMPIRTNLTSPTGYSYSFPGYPIVSHFVSHPHIVPTVMQSHQHQPVSSLPSLSPSYTLISDYHPQNLQHQNSLPF